VTDKLIFELSIELPGTPEQVWDAIATGGGISSWMMPTELEEREGGRVYFDMGPGGGSEGRVTVWEPGRRIAYEEPHWNELAGHGDEEVAPLVSEFLIEARSGGTCLLKVVSSAFASGAEWEKEFFEQMGEGWTPAFETLRLYLTHFPGQYATTMWAEVHVDGDAAPVWAAMRAAIGLTDGATEVTVRGIDAVVERCGDNGATLRVSAPVPGFVALFAYSPDGDKSAAMAQGQFFGPDAPAHVEAEQPAWEAWLAEVTAA
jgi:uncharacterized protein YndB with AHSA1/START domain